MAREKSYRCRHPGQVRRVPEIAFVFGHPRCMGQLETCGAQSDVAVDTVILVKGFFDRLSPL